MTDKPKMSDVIISGHAKSGHYERKQWFSFTSGSSAECLEWLELATAAGYEAYDFGHYEKVTAVTKSTEEGSDRCMSAAFSESLPPVRNRQEFEDRCNLPERLRMTTIQEAPQGKPSSFWDEWIGKRIVIQTKGKAIITGKFKQFRNTFLFLEDAEIVGTRKVAKPGNVQVDRNFISHFHEECVLEDKTAKPETVDYPS